MRTLANIFVFLLILGGILGCTQNICPAFQSYYILDEEFREKQFTYFAEDSMPRIDMAGINKSQFGIIDQPIVSRIPPPIRNPFARLNSVPMEIIYPAKVDSLEFLGDDIMFAEMDVVDTAALEEIEGKVWHFNIDQENYFNYIKKKVGLAWAEPASLLEDSELEEPETQADSLGVEPNKKKGIGGFLNKFKKKKDQKPDNNEEDQPPDNNN